MENTGHQKQYHSEDKDNIEDEENDDYIAESVMRSKYSREYISYQTSSEFDCEHPILRKSFQCIRNPQALIKVSSVFHLYMFVAEISFLQEYFPDCTLSLFYYFAIWSWTSPGACSKCYMCIFDPT